MKAMTSKTQRICEHEEEHIIDIVSVPRISNWFGAQELSKKITRYLNTKKPCTRCAKKK